MTMRFSGNPVDSKNDSSNRLSFLGFLFACIATGLVLSLFSAFYGVLSDDWEEVTAFGAFYNQYVETLEANRESLYEDVVGTEVAWVGKVHDVYRIDTEYVVFVVPFFMDNTLGQIEHSPFFVAEFTSREDVSDLRKNQRILVNGTIADNKEMWMLVDCSVVLWEWFFE